MKNSAKRGHHIFFSCGEASADRYGAALVAALRSLAPDLRFSALGGTELTAAGVDIVKRFAGINVMGFGEVVGALPAILRARKTLWRHLAESDIDLCVPIDFPGFNMRLAGQAKRRGIPVFYIVPPQFWAWGEWRMPGFCRNVDRIGTILPFEPDFFRQRGQDVIPLGHPLLDDYADYPFEKYRQEREVRLSDPRKRLTIGLLPGSRTQEIDGLMPLLKVTAQMIESWLQPRPVDFIVSVAPGVDPERMLGMVATGAQVSQEPIKDLCRRLDLAIVCSGTASLETAMAGLPHEVVYRTSALNYWLGKRLVKVDYIGLENLILEREMVPEHLQEQVAPVPLAGSILRWINRPSTRYAFYEDARTLRGQLGETGVWQRTAKEILALIEQQQVVQ